jgi:hypothetical protein
VTSQGSGAVGGPLGYLTNAMGDVYARLVDGVEEPVDPDAWGWLSDGGQVEERKSVDDLRGLPGFTVVEEDGPRIQPGPRPTRSVKLFTWKEGSAPPARAVVPLR